MRIAIVGGVLQYDPKSWMDFQEAPEIKLLRGIRERGHDVIPIGIRDWRKALHVASRDADLVHVHHIGRATLALALRELSTPIVYTPHYCSTYPRWYQRMAHRRMLSKADAVVALSPLEATRYICGAKSDSDRIMIIPNGFDVNRFTPVVRKVPMGDGPWRLLYVGQLIPLKQVDLLVRAVASDRLRGRTELRLIYHNGSCGAELLRLAQSLGVSDQVVFVGRKSGLELVREYHNAHVHLLASRTEALPSVITEAMLTGLPVIAPDVGGIAWQLDGGGHCLKRPTVDALVKAIVDVMTTYNTWTNRGADQATQARRRFDLTNMIDRHEDLYRRLVSRRTKKKSKSSASSYGIDIPESVRTAARSNISGVHE
jgi:glycosyltransferase involved in cell wall biosynthesis